MGNILVTCVGSGVGQSAVDSLILAGNNRIVGCDTNTNVYAYNLCHLFYKVPSLYSDNYIDFLIDICVKEKIDIIIPGHDHELVIFSKEIKKFEEKGITVIVSRPDLIEISRDKFLWYEYFSKRGCAIVPTIRVDEFKKNPIKDFLPAIIKPVGGSASQGVYIIHDFNELNNADDADIIQPYLFPVKGDSNYDIIVKTVEKGKFVQLSEISIQLIFTKESKFSGIFISKNTLKSGIPMSVDPIDPDTFEYIGEIMKFVPICEEKKVKGPVNIQGRITEKGLIFFEMNMRFTGITGNRAQLGFNEVEFLIENFRGNESELGGFSPNKMGVRQVACTTIPRIKSNTHKNFLILGAGGYIGSFFVNELIKSKISKDIYLVCRDSSFKKYEKLFGGNASIKIIKESSSSIESFYCKSDVFINFAGARANETEEVIYNSIMFQHKQAQILSKANIPLIINVSSQSVYDQKNDTIKKESSSLMINNLYAFQKHISEEFFKPIGLNNPAIKVISLRFTRVIGTPVGGNKPDGFFTMIIDSLKNNKEIKIHNPLNKINLIDIRDALSSIFHVINDIQKGKVPSVLNIGGENLSMKDYCNKVIESLNLKPVKDLIDYGKCDQADVSSMVDCSSAKDYGWEHKYSIENTIKDISSHF